MGDILRAASKMDIFAGLDEGDLSLVTALAETVEVPAGAVVFEEGEAGDAMYLIGAGQLQIGKGKGQRPGQYERNLATLSAGDVFGEMALVLGEPRTASARALTACTLHKISLDSFEGLVSGDDRVATALYRNIARALARRIRRIDEGLMGMERRWQKAPPDENAVADTREQLFGRGCTI